MSTPSESESAPKEPLLHPSADQPADTVSEDSSSDSSDGSGDQSSGASNSPNVKKVKKAKHSRKRRSAERSSASESESGSDSGSSSSGESGSAASSESDEAFKTPVAAIQPSVAQSSPVTLPPQVGVQAVVQQPIGVMAPTSSSGEPSVPPATQSPIVITPAKSLVLPASSPAPLPVILPPAAAEATSNQVQGTQSIQIVQEMVGELVPSKPVLSASLPVPSAQNQPVTANEVLEIEFDQLLALNTPSKPSVSDPTANKTKTGSKNSGKSSKHSVNREEERYLKRVLKVERALVRLEQGKKRRKAASKKKGGKQPKGTPRRKKKSKSKAPVSSDDESSDSSSSSTSSVASDPPSSNRIARIPTGRLLQQCALSRLNELGVARKPDAKLSEITEALRLIDDFELNISPQLAFSYFHQVPGTGLPHMVKHVVSFDERYGALVRSVVKFHLLLIQKALTDKLAAVNADQNAPLFLLWQFENDLARAPSTSTYLSQPATQASPPRTPVPKTPKTHRHSKSKKSLSKSASKPKSESNKRASTIRKRKHRRSGKKSGGSKKKRRRSESSSDNSSPSPNGSL